MPLSPEDQRARYLAKKMCGNCCRQATMMRLWGAGRRIPICARCARRLDQVVEELEEERWEAEQEPDYSPYL